MEKEDIKKLRIGDQIIYGGGDELGLSGFTTGAAYVIQSFYDYYGVVVLDDNKVEHQICMDNVGTYFYTQNEWNVKHKPKEDRVNHPSHYTWLKKLCGIEVIDITRHMDFCLGNAIKYILRAGRKQEASLTDNQKEIEDLKKAIFYINDRIKQLGGEV